MIIQDIRINKTKHTVNNRLNFSRKSLDTLKVLFLFDSATK